MPVMILGLLIRHALTFGGGAAVAATADNDAQAIAGAFATLVGLCWSAYEKYRASR